MSLDSKLGLISETILTAKSTQRRIVPNHTHSILRENRSSTKEYAKEPQLNSVPNYSIKTLSKELS